MTGMSLEITVYRKSGNSDKSPPRKGAGLMTAFFVGLDLAQPQESTALAVLAREVVARQTSYAVRHLERLPPGTPYPHMAREVSALLGSRDLRGCRLGVDQTAVGRAVASMFRPASAGAVLAVLISAGHAVMRGEDGCTHVPKKELVSAVQALLQTRRLRVAAGLPLAAALSREMASFRAAVKLTGSEEELTWRERDHDDLVLAVPYLKQLALQGVLEVLGSNVAMGIELNVEVVGNSAMPDADEHS
jgi:hypothetical protein